MHKHLPMMGIVYKQIDFSDIDIIQPVWEKIREHHRKVLVHDFQHLVDDFTFDQFKLSLAEKAKDGGAVYIISAVDEEADTISGYCATSLSKDGDGFLESIYVLSEYRSGIGEKLALYSVDWLDENNARSKELFVVYGNERVMKLAERFGFYPSRTVLTQINKKAD